MNLLDYVYMMCKDLLMNKFCNGIEYTSGTTYSIHPPPSKKRWASDKIKNTTNRRGGREFKLLNNALF